MREGTRIALAWPQGNSLSIGFARVDETGARLPFAEGDCVTFTLKARLTSEDCLLQKSCRTFTADGTALFGFEAAETAALPAGRYVYDVQFVSADGGVVDTFIRPSDFEVTRVVKNP